MKDMVKHHAYSWKHYKINDLPVAPSLALFVSWNATL
jgi:hypothetical protein